MKRKFLYIIIIVLIGALLGGIALTIMLMNSENLANRGVPASEATENTIEYDNSQSAQTDKLATEIEEDPIIQTEAQVIESTNVEPEMETIEIVKVTEPEETEAVPVETTESQKSTQPSATRPTGDDFGMGEF